MALAAGSVSIDVAGNVTKSGAAGALYDALVATLTNSDGSPYTIPSGAPGVPVKTSFASMANAFATWMVSQITSNAVVTVTVPTGASGLQRTPNPNDPSTDCLGPSATKTLSGSIT